MFTFGRDVIFAILANRKKPTLISKKEKNKARPKSFMHFAKKT
jgi:hypothetical protein